MIAPTSSTRTVRRSPRSVAPATPRTPWSCAPSGFTTTKEFAHGSFSRWTHVVARGATVLFYNRENASAAIGDLTANNFKTVKELAPGI